jgi:hypothetical protein
MTVIQQGTSLWTLPTYFSNCPEDFSLAETLHGDFCFEENNKSSILMVTYNNGFCLCSI